MMHKKRTGTAYPPLQIGGMRFQSGVRATQVLQVTLQLVRQGPRVRGLSFQVDAPAC
jgi:hypothetical protein